MAIRTVRIMAAFVFAVAGGCFAFAHPVIAADQIYVSSDEVFDAQCDPQGYCFGQSFCRKLKLHCLYARQACTAKYVTLPYTQPRSSIYLAPGYNGAGYAAPPPVAPQPVAPPPVAPMAGYPANPGYGPPPAYAPPGSVYIR
jgi:hypothetical protein